MGVPGLMGRHNDTNYVDPTKMGPPQTYPPIFGNNKAQVTNWGATDETEKAFEDAARERKQRKAGQEWLDAYDGKAPSPAPEDPRGPEPGADREERAIRAEKLRQMYERNAKIGQTHYPRVGKKK